ncbi:glycosyltransferase family 2 protein [Blastococcus capsensis]|uniref:glycosyltransferase family 2 protein n=1 Tax=Blastococcus capsensis TaxID=1564163 RepID=UPI0025409E27|nr:glycosyltransferase family A protein [Blastococcus capsensis]MDK3256758.1 glycosyltransferase family A protein [Blastococcus capsensis]
MTPPVSVVVVFKDEERFLPEAVDSVFGQRFDGWELLLVDDGSSDASAEIAREQVGRRPGAVRYLQHPDGANLGISASRKLGMDAAHGSFVAFLDGDDVWLPDKLGDQAALMRAHPEVGLVYGPVQLWHSWSAASAVHDHFVDLGVPPETLVPAPRLLPQLIENRYQSPTTSGSMLRRDVVDRVGGVDVRFRGMYEDQVLFTKLLAVSATYVSGRCWTRYRQRPDSLSARFEDAVPYHVGRLVYLRWAEDHLAATGTTDPEVWRSLRRELSAARHPRLTRLRHGVGARVRHGLGARLRARRGGGDR